MTETFCCGGYPEYYEAGNDKYHRIKEKISCATINMICAEAGLVFQQRDHADDIDSIDATIRLPKDKRIIGRKITRPFLDLQIKATSSPTYIGNGNIISYSLPRKNYEDLADDGNVPPILALMVLPKDVSTWMQVCKENVVIRECVYWCNPTSCVKDVDANQGNVSIHIPVKNILNTHTLHKLLDTISNGEVMPNEIQ